MRSSVWLRRVSKGIVAVLLLPLTFYGLDYLYARARHNAFGDVAVDRMFAMTNRWGAVEYSVGKSGYERCVYSVFPHFGYVPCWYLKTQDVRYIRIG